MKNLKELWNDACLKAGIHSITTDTAAMTDSHSFKILKTWINYRLKALTDIT